MKRSLSYWILGSFLFQLGLFLYLDKVVFAPAVSFTQRAVLDEQTAEIIGSPDNTSFAYVGGGWLKVYNHQAGYVGEFAVPNEGKVTYFEYYPDRNLVVAGTTLSKGGSTTVICQEINTQSSHATQWQIKGLSKGAAIQESAYLDNPETLHFLLRDGASAYLYRTGKELQRLKTNTTQINRITGLPNEKLVLFDNKTKGTIHSISDRGELTQLDLPKGSYVLIGVDQEERIYLGQLSDKKKVTALLAGYQEGGFMQIDKFTKPLEPSALRISVEGQLLISP